MARRVRKSSPLDRTRRVTVVRPVTRGGCIGVRLGLAQRRALAGRLVELCLEPRGALERIVDVREQRLALREHTRHNTFVRVFFSRGVRGEQDTNHSG